MVGIALGKMPFTTRLWSMADALVSVKCLFAFTGLTVPAVSYMSAWSHWQTVLPLRHISGTGSMSRMIHAVHSPYRDTFVVEQ